MFFFSNLRQKRSVRFFTHRSQRFFNISPFLVNNQVSKILIISWYGICCLGIGWLKTFSQRRHLSSSENMTFLLDLLHEGMMIELPHQLSHSTSKKVIVSKTCTAALVSSVLHPPYCEAWPTLPLVISPHQTGILFCKLYISSDDYIHVYSKTSSEHIQHLWSVLEVLRKKGNLLLGKAP